MKRILMSSFALVALSFSYAKADLWQTSDPLPFLHQTEAQAFSPEVLQITDKPVVFDSNQIKRFSAKYDLSFGNIYPRVYALYITGVDGKEIKVADGLEQNQSTREATINYFNQVLTIAKRFNRHVIVLTKPFGYYTEYGVQILVSSEEEAASIRANL